LSAPLALPLGAALRLPDSVPDALCEVEKERAADAVGAPVTGAACAAAVRVADIVAVRVALDDDDVVLVPPRKIKYEAQMTPIWSGAMGT
jgi:hypothetical protein